MLSKSYIMLLYAIKVIHQITIRHQSHTSDYYTPSKTYNRLHTHSSIATSPTSPTSPTTGG